MLLKYIFYGLLIYFLYKFIFELVIPVGKATSQVKDKMREMQQMQQRQQEQFQQQQQQQARAQQQASTAPSKGDYIEFEEVK